MAAARSKKEVFPMPDMENKVDAMENDLEAITDDELEAVAGGGKIFANAAEEKRAKEQAYADGRTYMMPSGYKLFPDLDDRNYCMCSHKYKWAMYKVNEGPGKGHYYRNIKCYNCQGAWDRMEGEEW